jgi:hypothetical protein
MSTATLTPTTGGPPSAGAAAPRAAGSCPANIRETKICFGFVAQTDLPTPNTAAEMWSMTKTNPALAVVTPVMEDDSQDIGKGDEFPTTTFPTNVDTAVAIEKYCSSEFLAWLFCFSTGKATKTGTAPALTYAAVPSDPVVNCIDLPPFTYAEQIRAEPDSVIDRALVGMVINDLTLTMESGPGRANCRVAVNCVGTGMVENPSGIIMPALTPEHFLNASGATININGIDYVLAASFISCEFRWNNNVRLPSGLYPGSGVQNGFAIRGRMEYGNRECTFTFVARAAKGSIEFNALMNQTEGPATIAVKGAVIAPGPDTHGFQIDMPRTTFSAVVNGETDGIVNVTVTVRVLKPTTGDYVTMSATTTKDGILGL